MQNHNLSMYGTATVGTKGQIVIPADAREEFNLEPGAKVFVFGVKDKQMLGICPVESMDAWMQSMSNHLEKLKSAVEDGKK
jgi:AbrB family looped-hinge helix DNA binding protein